MRVDLTTREALVAEGYLSKSEDRGLVLYNYTARTTYEGRWDEVTINSRGTVYEAATGQVVAWAFPKFFNLGQTESTQPDALPDEPYTVSEKWDGSLGVIFRYGGEWRACTRGSFHSEQAAKALSLLGHCRVGAVPDGVNLCVEIIYPANRIIVDYGEAEMLVLLGAFDVATGDEWSEDEVTLLGQAMGMPTASPTELTIADAVGRIATETWQTEGWVLRFASGLRVKIKTADYLRLARAKAHLGPLMVWEAECNGDAEAFIADMPDELQPEAERLLLQLRADLRALESVIRPAADVLGLPVDGDIDRDTAASLACSINRVKAPAVRAALFALMRGRDHRPALLRALKPTGNEWRNWMEAA